MNLRILSREPEPGDPSRVLFLLPSEGEATAEDLAMLQALYSRDPRPIDNSLKLVKSTTSGEFMKKFYVGYGHSSIAECGSVVIAIENVPMIVAKAIQHYALYRGQESSTRYLDFSVQPFASFTERGREYQEKLRAFYMEAMPETIDHMRKFHCLNAAVESELKAAKAAAFDVLRGFLPIGALTNLSWAVDLRNLNERLSILDADYAPMYPEVGRVTAKIRSLMKEVFPNTLSARAVSDTDFKFDGPQSTIDIRYFTNSVYVEWEGFLDFASWRDLARHRSVTQTFPMLTKEFGPEEWYLNHLPPSLKEKGAELLKDALNTDVDAYALPMAYKIPFTLSGHLAKFKYILKQRTTQVVHPTLRNLMIPFGRHIQNMGMNVEMDPDPAWTVGGKRGMQDIIQK